MLFLIKIRIRVKPTPIICTTKKICFIYHKKFNKKICRSKGYIFKNKEYNTNKAYITSTLSSHISSYRWIFCMYKSHLRIPKFKLAPFKVFVLNKVDET